MKISKLFHSLYAVLMFLPVMVIPIFAININQKSVEPIQVEVQEKISVDFNQKAVLQTSENRGINFIRSENDISSGVISGTCTSGFSNITLNYQLIANHYYAVRCYIDTSATLQYGFLNAYGGQGPINQTWIFHCTTFSGTYTGLTGPIGFSVNGSCTVNITDLTIMFGEGKEPTKEEYDLIYPNLQPYTENQKMLINKPTTTIYNDTDIGSQFLYSLYIPVHDYFNIVNWMNLGGLYDWFLLNIFNGVNALVIEIIFNLIVYWLMVSFVWLIFDVLMYVPSMIHKMLDKARME